MELLFDLLRPESLGKEASRRTGGTVGRYGDVVSAVVATERTVVFVVGERYVAVGTHSGPTTCPAGYEGGESPPVLEEHYLASVMQCFVDVVEQDFIEV